MGNKVTICNKTSDILHLDILHFDLEILVLLTNSKSFSGRVTGSHGICPYQVGTILPIYGLSLYIQYIG